MLATATMLDIAGGVDAAAENEFETYELTPTLHRPSR
jgi:hypothetical protein